MPNEAPVIDLDAALIAAAHGYFESRHAMVAPFVKEHFGIIGTLRLHRHALGLDILRAPLNMLLSPIYLLVRLSGALCKLAHMPRVAEWLATRRILLRTATAAEVERLIVVELLQLPWDQGPVPSTRDALAETLRDDPALANQLVAKEPKTANLGTTINAYSGTRAAVSEMTTALGTMGAGATLFKTLTPGVATLGPAIAALLAHNAAIAAFPLGATVGSLWYGWFPIEVPFELLATSIVGLMLSASVFTAFAGIIADPVQAALGIHQRRLHRLIDALETDFSGNSSRSFAAREHYYARIMDLADVGASTLRLLRG